MVVGGLGWVRLRREEEISRRARANLALNSLACHDGNGGEGRLQARQQLVLVVLEDEFLRCKERRGARRTAPPDGNK